MTTRLAILLAILAVPVLAQEAEKKDAAEIDAEKFEKQSLALRTALHYEPSLEAPLKALIQLYRKANRTDDLIAIYQSHLSQYAADANARGVLIRIKRELREPDAEADVKAAAKQHPKHALIAFLHFETLQDQRDPKALDELSRAIQLETHSGRKRAWIDKLIPLAITDDRPEIATGHLKELAEINANAPDALLALSRKMQKHRFHKLALETAQNAIAVNKSPETGVDLELVAAQAEASLKQYEEAAKRLDALLTKVSPDYWRRQEIVIQRVNLLQTDAAREAMLKSVREKYAKQPNSEAVALDLAELLVACELRRDALDHLLQVSKKLPDSERIEKETLELFDRLNDERSAKKYLEERLKKFPDRVDLAYRYVKALFLVGEREKARKTFDELLEKIDEGDRLKRMVEMARFLRRMTLPTEAASIFERVVEVAPERLDVRRELAETYLASGRHSSARKLFSNELAESAEIENFLDVVQFMISQELLTEARAALLKRMETNETNFDLRMVLLDVYGKLGEQSEGEKIVLEARKLADTDVRYNQWLEASSLFYEFFDDIESFIAAELARLQTVTEWTPSYVGRFLMFCALANRSDLKNKVTKWLRERIAHPEVPEDVKPKLRRLLVDTLEGNPAYAKEVEDQLKALINEDETRRDEYNLRIAKSYHEAQRIDLAQRILEGIDLKNIKDTKILAGTHKAFLDSNMPEKAVAVLERLTELEPVNKQHWELWLTLLAGVGDEVKLRYALRRLVVGIDRMPLGPDTQTMLRSHLVDSYWRSVAKYLAEDDTTNRGEIFALLDAIERAQTSRDENLWVAWTRAYVLNSRGLTRARDQAVVQLESLAKTAKARESKKEGEKEKEKPEPLRIYFPDGLALSLKHALAMLREPPTTMASPRSKVQGPLPELGTAWAFQTDGNNEITHIKAVGENRVLITDKKRSHYLVDRTTGKLIWRKGSKELFGIAPPVQIARRSVASVYSSRSSRYYYTSRRTGSYPLPPGAAYSSSYRSATNVYQLTQEPLVDGDRIYTTGNRRLVCLSAKDGAKIWEGVVEFGESMSLNSAPPVYSLFLDRAGNILSFDPISNTAFSIAKATGKLRWVNDLPLSSTTSYTNIHSLNSGASYSDGYLFVYGQSVAILDADTGEAVWSFEGGKVRSFPLELQSVDEEREAKSLLSGSNFLSTVFPTTATMPGIGRPVYINHLATVAQREQAAKAFLAGKGTLVAPAVDWAQHQQRGSYVHGYLAGKRLLLMNQSGVRILSLELPLSGLNYNVSGSFVGVEGNKAVFLSSPSLVIINLSRSETKVVQLAKELGSDRTTKGYDAVLAGSRIYISGEKGVMCVNIHTARRIFFSPWPETLARFREKSPNPQGTTSSTTSHFYTWSGVATQGTSPICYSLRNNVDGASLFTLVNSSTVVALKSDEE